MIGQLIALGFALMGAVAFALYGLRYRERLSARHNFPVFTALADEVGRAAEEGALLHITLGNGSLTGESAMTSVAALEGLTALSNLAAAYDTPPIITTGDPTLYLLADDWMRRAYTRIGKLERYHPTLVQFTASNAVTYAAMAATYLYEKGIGSNIMLGAFEQEVSLLTEAAARRGIYSVGAAVSPAALGALYPALGPRRLVIGEELFAGGAEVTQNTMYQASLKGQDLLRWLVAAGIILMAMLSLLELGIG